MKTEQVNKTCRGNTQGGFTLIEILIAMAIFAIGILALGKLQISYIGGNAHARMQTEATALASRVIEQLRSLPFDAPDLDPAANPHQSAWANAGEPYTVQWNVTDNAPVNNAKTVEVTVAPDNRRIGRPVVIRTIIGE